MLSRVSFFLLCTLLLPAAQAPATEPAQQTASAHANAAKDNSANSAHHLGMLPEQLKTAATNNSRLQAAFAKWRAAVQQAPQAAAMPDPQLRFGYYIEPVETRTGPQRMRYGISQKFPWAGTLSQKEKIALHQADVLKSKADTIKLEIFRDVKTAYYELAYLEQAINITRENKALVDYMESIVRTKYTTGNVPYADVLRTQVVQDKLQERLTTLEDFRRPVTARLNAAMSQPADAVVPAPESIPVMELALDDEELKQALAAQHPGLAGLDHQLAAASEGIVLAEKGYYPDITIGLDSIYTDSPRGSGSVTNGGNDPVIASVAINLPLWRESLDAAVKQSKEERLAALKSKKGLEEKLVTDLELVLYKYRDAARRITLYRDTLIPKAEQVIEVMLEAFQAGRASSLDLLDAEKTYFELQLASARALADQAQLVAQMEYLVGGEIPCRYHGYIMKKVAVPEQELATSVQNAP